MSETLILTKRWGTPNSAALETYRADGGYAALDKALGMEPVDAPRLDPSGFGPAAEDAYAIWAQLASEALQEFQALYVASDAIESRSHCWATTASWWSPRTPCSPAMAAAWRPAAGMTADAASAA